MTLETLLKLPGFLYEVNGHYYYLGKWICKECTEIEATDCVSIYRRSGKIHWPDYFLITNKKTVAGVGSLLYSLVLSATVFFLKSGNIFHS